MVSFDDDVVSALDFSQSLNLLVQKQMEQIREEVLFL